MNNSALIEKLVELTEKNKLEWEETYESDIRLLMDAWGYRARYRSVWIKVLFPWPWPAEMKIDYIKIRNLPKKQIKKLAKVIALQISHRRSTQKENKEIEHQKKIEAIIKE